MALDFLQKKAGIGETTLDRIGGGSFIVNSGAYPAKVTKAYLQQSNQLNYHLKPLLHFYIFWYLDKILMLSF